MHYYKKINVLITRSLNEKHNIFVCYWGKNKIINLCNIHNYACIKDNSGNPNKLLANDKNK